MLTIYPPKNVLPARDMFHVDPAHRPLTTLSPTDQDKNLEYSNSRQGQVSDRDRDRDRDRDSDVTETETDETETDRHIRERERGREGGIALGGREEGRGSRRERGRKRVSRATRRCQDFDVFCGQEDTTHTVECTHVRHGASIKLHAQRLTKLSRNHFSLSDYLLRQM